MIDEGKKQLVLDAQEVFGSEAGKRVMDVLSSWCHYNDSFGQIVQCGLPQHTAIELGKREVYLFILGLTKADPNRELQENTDEQS